MSISSPYLAMTAPSACSSGDNTMRAPEPSVPSMVMFLSWSHKTRFVRLLQAGLLLSSRGPQVIY